MKTLYKFFNLFSKWRFLNDQEKTELIIKELMSQNIFTLFDIIEYDINIKEGFVFYRYQKNLSNFNYTYTKVFYKPLKNNDLYIFDNIWTIIKDNKRQPNNLDEVLDKISEKGIESLTYNEMDYLNNFTK
jgi:hypothetical protein